MGTPEHYNTGKIQPIDFIADQKLNFNLGNALKYICRAGKKPGNDKNIDLKKAIDYIQHEISMADEKSCEETISHIGIKESHGRKDTYEGTPVAPSVFGCYRCQFYVYLNTGKHLCTKNSSHKQGCLGMDQ